MRVDPRWLVAFGLATVVVAAVASESASLGLSRGAASLDVGAGASTAEQCGRCHAEQLAQWEGSRHRVAHTNALYQAGLVAETSAFCVNCHSPLRAQADEVLGNLAWYRWQDPRHRRGPVEPERAPEPLAGEGVTCVVCHLRDGVVLVDELPETSAPHAMRVEPGLTDGTLCGGCHEFGMPAFAQGTFSITDVPMQSTLSEWQDWVAAGGETSCVDCHMGDGRHGFEGAHDRERLAASLDVRVRRRRGELVVQLQTVGVGHDLPSGDLFRAIGVEVARGSDAPWVEVHRAGRTFEVVHNAEGGISKRPLGDTRLHPGEVRRVPIPADGPARWRVVYHYGSANDEVRGVIPMDQLIAVLAEGIR
jgi:hypothetical protein